jgi:uncharacterized protein YceH (UPF0502 family)
VFNMSDAELAIMCLLFLRGPLTPGEINTNSGKLYHFESLQEVLQQLESLLTSDPPFVSEVPRKHGQKEARYIHLLQEVSEEQLQASHQPHTEHNNSDIETRVALLEDEVKELRELVKSLMKGQQA